MQDELTGSTVAADFYNNVILQLLKVLRQRSEIRKTEDGKESLMYENLLNGPSKEEINSLPDYIVSLQ